MSLTRPEIAAVKAYSDTSYTNINGHLRFGERADENTKAVIKCLDSAISKNITERDIVVYRGVDDEYARILERRGVNPGDSLIDAGYLSTSTRQNVARRFLGWEGGGIILKINVPKGSAALDMNPYSKNADEHEILLPRDAELRVIGYDATADMLEVEVVT